MLQKWLLRKKENRDKRNAMIGKAISRTLRTGSPIEPCPPSEEISAFLDGRLKGEQRERLLGHLTRCDQCFNVFSFAHEMMEMEENESEGMLDLRKKRSISFKVPIRGEIPSLEKGKRSWFYPAMGIAAAAVFIIVIGFLVPILRPYTPPSSSQFVAELSKKTEPQRLSQFILHRGGTTFGFGPGTSPEKGAFRIGATLLPLEIAFVAGDREGAIALIQRLISGLRSFEGTDEIISFYTDISRNIEGGLSPEQFKKKEEILESFFEDRGLLIFLRFGEWTEAGRVASRARNRDFFNVKEANYFIEQLPKSGWPEGLSKTLEEVKVILSKKEFSEKDFERLETAFLEILNFM